MSELKRDQLLAAVIAGRGPAFLRGVNLASINLSGAGWLMEADLRGADLSNANLKRANLKGANLEKANLHSANLTGASLEGANLFRVKAEVANLNMANLRGANMKGANLVSANLVKADLEDADLEGADLEGANLEASNLTRTRITNVNLKMANLDGVDLTETVLAPGIPEGENGEFHGTMTAIKLADLLQIGCLSRSNLNVAVYSAAGQGNIYIGSGRVLHAHVDDKSGEEAFMEILGWERGRFITFPCTPSWPITIDKPIELLVLQWMRLQDEKSFSSKFFGMIEKMQEYMPIQAHPSHELMDFLEKDGKNLAISDNIEITNVFHTENDEDILCSISANGKALIAPLKFLDLDGNHPLHDELAKIR